MILGDRKSRVWLLCPEITLTDSSVVLFHFETAIALGSVISSGLSESLGGRISEAIQFLFYASAAILCARSIQQARRAASRASRASSFRPSYVPPPVYEAGIGSMPTFPTRSIPRHYRKPSFHDRCGFAFATSSSRITSFFSRKPEIQENTSEKTRESSVPDKAPALQLNLHRSLPPLPQVAYGNGNGNGNGNGIDRSSSASLLSIDIERLFTRFRASFMASHRGSNPDFPRSVTPTSSRPQTAETRPQTAEPRPQMEEVNKFKRPGTAASDSSYLPSDFEHSTTAIVTSAPPSTLPAAAFDDSNTSLTIKRGGTARYVHYPGSQSLSGSVSIWSNRTSMPLDHPPLPPTPLSPQPTIRRHASVKRDSSNSEQKVGNFQFPPAQKSTRNLHLSPLSIPNSEDSPEEGSNDKQLLASSSESDHTTPPSSTRQGRLRLITSFPEPPTSPGPVSGDTFGDKRSGIESESSFGSSTSSNSAHSFRSHHRKDSDSTVKQVRSRKGSKTKSLENEEKKESFNADGNATQLNRSGTVSS